MIPTSRAALKLRRAISTSPLREKCSRGNPPSSTVGYRRAFGDRKRRFVQPRGLALRRGDDHAGIGAGDHRFSKLALDSRGVAGERAVDDRIELQFGGVGDDRHDVLERHLALAVGVERELAQFVAGGPAVAAEQRHQDRTGIGRNAQAGNAQFVVDQFGQIALGVGIAGDRDRRLGALAGLAQRRFRPAARRPRSRCGNPSAAIPRAYRRRWQNCASRRGRGSRGGRRTAAPSWLRRPAATARPTVRRRRAAPAKTDRWGHRRRMPSARRRARAPGRRRDHRAG
mgnify:CR=1 FL=1